MKIALIDDEIEARNNMKALLNDYCKDFKIIGEATSVKSGIKLLKEIKPDVLFLDVKMGDGTGFDLLDLISSSKPRVIFVTAFDEFAIKAFKYNAIDYLLKPINPKELVDSFEKIIDLKNESQSIKQIENLIHTVKNDSFQTITVSTQEGVYFLKLDDIMRIQGEKNYSTFYLEKGEKILVSKSLKYFEDILPKKDFEKDTAQKNIFFRSHQSHIVQINYVHKLSKEDGGYIILNNEQGIPISRRKKEEFLKIIGSK